MVSDTVGRFYKGLLGGSEKMSHKHCVFCGEEVSTSSPANYSPCSSELNTTQPNTIGNRSHAVIMPRSNQLNQESKEVGQMIRDGDTVGLAAYASKNVKERAARKMSDMHKQRVGLTRQSGTWDGSGL